MVARRIGWDVGEEMATALLEAADKQFDGNVQTAFRFMLEEVIKDVGIESLETLEKFTDEYKNILFELDQANLTAAETVKAIVDSFDDLVNAAHRLDSVSHFKGVATTLVGAFLRMESGLLSVKEMNQILNLEY